MSTELKIGEIVIIQNQVGEFAKNNDMEVEVIDGLEVREVVNCATGQLELWACYEIVDCFGEEACYKAEDLRRKPPKQSSDAWAESKVRELTKPVVQPELETA